MLLRFCPGQGWSEELPQGGFVAVMVWEWKMGQELKRNQRLPKQPAGQVPGGW